MPINGRTITICLFFKGMSVIRGLQLLLLGFSPSNWRGHPMYPPLTTCQFAKRINKTDWLATICLVQASDLVGKKHQDLFLGYHLESNTPCLKHRSKPPFVAGQTSSSIVGSLPSFHSFNRHHVNFSVSILQNRHSHFSRQMSSNEIP